MQVFGLKSSDLQMMKNKLNYMSHRVAVPFEGTQKRDNLQLVTGGLSSLKYIHTRCGYKITGPNFFLLLCKLGSSKQRVVLACAVPSIHSYNFKSVRQTVRQ
jgi:hypothetical protein